MDKEIQKRLGPRQRRLRRVVERMMEYDVKCGNDSDAWEDFKDDHLRVIGCEITEAQSESSYACHVSDADGRAFCDYWTDVASGVSWDYDAVTGSNASI